MQQLWRLDATADLAWRHWDGEFVVHHALSNDTHRLSDLAGELLLLLTRGTRSIAALAAELDADEPLVDDTLAALAGLGLVERC
ncbi:HPr-rel-A system PqqD family peptide chaperone [Aquabacterium humicola]|uniref:HPr-rel-A system PqqD family peptide chaperone n=1 Tax=Aquabacterium humicola TaxID=3237377 RepID=UPI002542846F|nr:HPr-rel-A system PqqD family peptide chaperone [Rubrivivax pictus]